LRQRIAPRALSGVRIYFPDPWPKKRHHKRRLVQPAFIALLASRMEEGAILHLATDWAPYAEHMLEVLHAAPEFENLAADGGTCQRPGWRPRTKYERRGERLGHAVFDIVFRRRPAPGKA
jgi:tRNA (guanine-N7-)-methyltransferase